MHYSNASQPQNYATASNCWVKSMPGSNRSNNALRCACPNNPINPLYGIYVFAGGGYINAAAAVVVVVSSMATFIII